MSVHAKTVHQKRRVAVDVHTAAAVGIRTEPAEEDRDLSEHDLVPAVGIMVAVGISNVFWIVVGLVVILIF